jgi:pilus assembly protein CpaB
MFLFKLRFIIPVALVSGMCASYGVFSYLKKEQAQRPAVQIATRPVVVAALSIPLGTPLRAEALQIKQWPEDLAPDSSFQEIDAVIGRVMKTEVIAGEPILSTKLAPTGSGGGVPGLIPAGMRAFTVAVNVVSGVGGFILPGTRVDVLATVSPSGMKNGTTTKTILQNVAVLAVDQTFNKNGDDPVVVKSVTLVVSPDEAEKLALASNEGKLQLVLRNGADLETHNTDGVKISQFNGYTAPAPRAVLLEPVPEKVEEEEEAPAKVVEVLRANVRSEVAFEPSGTTRKKSSKQ